MSPLTTLSKAPQSCSTGAKCAPRSTTGLSLSLGTDLTAATDVRGVGTRGTAGGGRTGAHLLAGQTGETLASCDQTETRKVSVRLEMIRRLSCLPG